MRQARGIHPPPGGKVPEALSAEDGREAHYQPETAFPSVNSQYSFSMAATPAPGSTG